MGDTMEYDFIVVGSGFGGSVAALRLAEKGYRVAVLEMGKRFRADDFPKTSWNLRRFLWLPAAKLHGFFRMTVLQHAFILSGCGVGGGSLVYANTLLEPPDKVWDDPQWKDLADWKREMPECYATAKRMLGVVTNPSLGEADHLLHAAASSCGVGHTFYPTDIGVYFGAKGEKAPDPFFGGEGPERTGCELCGGCVVGCRYDGKNTLDKNYLHLAEKRGVRIIPETRVVDVTPLNGHKDGRDGYAVRTESATAPWFGPRLNLTARGIVFAGGVLGTVPLLMALRESGSLPGLSDQLGQCVRTNSESIIGVKLRDKKADVCDGVAIGSGIYLDDHTHVEAVRYPKGSDALGFLLTPLTDGTPGPLRIASWLGMILRRPVDFLRLLNPFGMATSTVILLVMQTLSGRIRMGLRRSWWWPFSKRLVTLGDKVPAYIPQANRFARSMGTLLNGVPATAITEILLDIPTTAHILGGAVMGASRKEGVIDGQSRVFGYRNMYVCDGSTVSANLGVNPSLTITALAEKAMQGISPASAAEWHTNKKGEPVL